MKNKYKFALFVILVMIIGVAGAGSAGAAGSAVPVTLAESTATFSQAQNGLYVYEAVDGITDGSYGGYNGWATWNGNSAEDHTAVWETSSDVNASRLDFALYHTWAASHSLGHFRLSYTTDDRSTFADGLTENGDVDANWTVLTGATISGTGGETFTILADNSILVSGSNPATTVYSVSFEGNFSGVTGIRLEALTDPSLPYNGPGRGGNGNWHLVEITLDATPPSPLDDGGWELVAHMSNVGGMFDGNGELAPTYSHGTFVQNPVPSTPDFQREFPVVADKILFITGDRSIWAIADYGDMRALIDPPGSVSTAALNLAFEIGVNGAVSNTIGNVLSRTGVNEDPWISMDGDHSSGIPNQRIVWGENNYNGSHVALKNNHGGINVYIKAANDSDGDGVPDDQDAFPNDPDRTVSCLAGYYGATSCIPAPLGTFVAADGALTADLCPLGTFSDQLASTACTAAPAGTFVDFVGAAAATACAPGSYQDLEGQTSCFEAPIGFYVPGTGSTAATACPAGSTTASTASTSLSDCVNEPPVVTAGVSYSGSEGSPIALNAATASDREGPIGSYSWTVDDTLCSFDDDSIVDPQLTCADNGTFAATLTVSDGYLSNSSTATVTVNNVDPTVTSLVVPWHEPIDIAEEALSSVDVTFFDPAGTNDNSYTCDFDLDYNGTTFASDASVSTSYGSCSTPLAYDSPGVYTVMVVVSDKDLGSDSATAAEFIVVFDPSGGFVTGGGWIDSPAGAYKDDETLKGKANFGFVAKYKKGANVPDGNTQFQFKAGDLNFHSSSYEWLVVAGNKAQFKGEGTINGEGSYMFKISADDDNPDTFRIHIWGDTGTVYDNGSQQELGGGSIKVHNGK